MKAQIMYNKTRLAFMKFEYQIEMECYREEIESEKNSKLGERLIHYNQKYADTLLNHYMDRCKM